VIICSDSDRPWEISSVDPRSRLITIFRISTVPLGRTTPTAGFPDVEQCSRRNRKVAVVTFDLQSDLDIGTWEELTCLVGHFQFSQQSFGRRVDCPRRPYDPRRKFSSRTCPTVRSASAPTFTNFVKGSGTSTYTRSGEIRAIRKSWVPEPEGMYAPISVFRAVTIPSNGARTILNASRASSRFTFALSAITVA
jgi:hypothetical protein